MLLNHEDLAVQRAGADLPCKVPGASALRAAYTGAVSISDEELHDASAGDKPSSSFLLPFTLLFAPDRGMERHARAGRGRWFFLVAWLCSILLGAAVGYRVDARSSTLRKLDMSGQLQSMSDRQIADETRQAERVSQVVSIAKGVVGAPVQLGLTCVSLLALGWFFRGRVKGRAVVPVAATVLLPGAIANLIDAVSAFRHPMIPPEGVPLGPRSLSGLLLLVGRPLMGPWLKLGTAFDFFSLWAAVMLGYGVAAVGQIPKKRALIGTLIAWVCYRLLTHVAPGG